MLFVDDHVNDPLDDYIHSHVHVQIEDDDVAFVLVLLLVFITTPLLFTRARDGSIDRAKSIIIILSYK